MNDVKEKYSISDSQKAWYWPLIWFVFGFGLFIFTRVGNHVSWALPVAAVFILRFSRSQRPLRAILLMSLGFPLAGMASQMSFSGSGFEIALRLMQLITKGLIFMIPYGIDRLLQPRVKGFKASLIFPVAAIAVYFLDSTYGLFKGTAHFYAFMQYGNQTLMQILSIAGIWGLGFFLLWTASFVNWLWENELRWKKIKTGFFLFTAVTLVLVSYGGFRSSPRYDDYEGDTVKVASVIYDNHAPEDVIAMFRHRRFTDLDRVLPLIEMRISQAAEAGAEIIALQEYGILVPEAEEALLVAEMKRIARENNVYLCVNYLYLPPMQQDSYEYTFGFIELPDEEEGRNKALLINDRGDVLIEYVKRHLPVLEGNYILNSESDQIPVVETPYGRIGLVICKDMEYSRFMRQAGQENADIIIAPSSEAARALAITYSQMLRAVEYGFNFVRPCNYGMSVAVDYRGNILGSMNSFTTPLETMYAHVPTSGTGTIYSLTGDMFAWLCCLALLGIAVYGIWKPEWKEHQE